MRWKASNCVSKEDWHRWYAWHPIRLEDEWVWREWVERKITYYYTTADCISSCQYRELNKSRCYCECGHETLQDPLSRIYEAGTFTNIICSKCDRQSTWDLDAPVPLFIKSIR